MRQLFIIIFLIFNCVFNGVAQTNCTTCSLLVTNKKKTELVKVFKVGERVELILNDGSENKGKIIGFDSLNIYLKKGPVAIENILRMHRIRTGLDLLGGGLGGAGMIILFENAIRTSSIIGNDQKQELIITGVTLTLIGTALIYRKSYSQRKWLFQVTN